MRSHIYGDAGNDTITVNGGAQHKIYGGAGADTIKLVGSGGDTVYTGGSSSKNYNKVYIGTAYNSSATVTGSKQTDSIAINGGYKHQIDTGESNDIIYSSSKQNSIEIIYRGDRQCIGDKSNPNNWHALGDSSTKWIVLHDNFYERPKYYSDNEGGTLVMGTGNNTLTIHGYGYAKDVLKFGEVSGNDMIRPMNSLYIQYA